MPISIENTFSKGVIHAFKIRKGMIVLNVISKCKIIFQTITCRSKSKFIWMKQNGVKEINKKSYQSNQKQIIGFFSIQVV